jgi:hypothetical protein
MDRKKATFILAGLLLAAVAVAAFTLLPKKYTVAQTMQQAAVFWNAQDAYVFLTLSTTGRTQNVIQEKLAAAKSLYLTVLLGGSIDFARENIVAYHLAGGGKLDRFALPDRTTASGIWSLENGQLQLMPLAGAGGGTQGFRWDGAKFITVSPAQTRAHSQSTSSSTLTADDDDEDERSSFLSQDARRQFKAAHWHYKLLRGYDARSSSEASLPIHLAGNAFALTIESTPFTPDGTSLFDVQSFGIRNLRLSGDQLVSDPQVLWNRNGWQPVSKQEYERLKQQNGDHRFVSPLTWGYLLVLAALLLWKFAGWFRALFAWGTVKRRVVENMVTSYSFPPATPAQFPMLDGEGLNRYTRELEGMGFTRLLDFSLLSDSPTYTPNFCRLFAHTRHHCFATLYQPFPKGKSPLPLKCSLESGLQNGWSLAFTDRRPQAFGSLVRRRRALGVCMPEATTSELLQAMLKMRSQVCVDLGISPLNDDSLEAYISRTQRAAAEARAAVEEKNFAKGLAQVYLRKFSLRKQKPEYSWLGDYPKEAEQRKQGFGSFTTSVR